MPNIFKEVQKTFREFSGFVCNKCKAKYDKDNYIEVDNSFVWDDVGGYGSLWGDGNYDEIVLCQICAYEGLKDYAEINKECD